MFVFVVYRQVRERNVRKTREEKSKLTEKLPKTKVLMFDGDEENHDRCEIQWRAFTHV